MNKRNIILSTLLLVALPVSAVTLDYRHEWQDISRSHKDRVSVSHRFASGLGFSLETKWRSGGDNTNQPYNDVVSNGTESSLNYQYKINRAWFVQPGFSLESSGDKSIYKPFITSGYTFSNGFSFRARYRYEYTRETQRNKEDMKTNRGEFWLGYRYQDWRFEYNYIYKHSDRVRFDNKKWDYEHNIKALWNMNASWSPYAEVGNIGVNKVTDHRQTRMRLGLQYHF
ncbi:oligogalacturonate-specific porin KdgM family protein [Erwinia oleae]|uniref:oligogalacturonate-specific porin KdgM family protein n=1 Tax=Erwinia oleae TaxID=796334 RepID=UPI0005586ABE|nr:oligogalacturonate-specific porin KdgM family protein [Erwinia oleae]